MENKSAKQILIEMDQLLAKPENWTQGANARNKTGSPVLPFDSDAYCFCLSGALMKVCNGLGQEESTNAWNLIYNVIKDENIGVTRYNDTPGRNFADIKGLLSLAIHLAGQDEGSS